MLEMVSERDAGRVTKSGCLRWSQKWMLEGRPEGDAGRGARSGCWGGSFEVDV